jgi:AcrR family transcriptional regulator
MSKKNIILRHATSLFATHGFKETTVAKVSELSDVASATIFYHFKTKESLLIAALDNVKATIINKIEAYKTNHSFANGFQMVEELVAYYLFLAAEMPDEFLLLHRHFPYQLAEANEECRSHLVEVYSCLVDIFELAILSGQRDGSIAELPAHKTALILFSSVDGIVRFNTYKLYDAGTLYHELLRCCRLILQPQPGPYIS